MGFHWFTGLSECVNRGYYMVARRYELHIKNMKDIKFISSSHGNVLFIIWRLKFNIKHKTKA